MLLNYANIPGTHNAFVCIVISYLLSKLNHRRPIPHRAESIGPWIGNMETLVWLSSVTMGSFAYLFHPSTNIHSPYTPVSTLLAILISEHIFVALRAGIRQAFSMVPSLSEWLVRKEEYKLKKDWLERMIGNHKEFIARRDVDNDNDLAEGLSAKLWHDHLDRQDRLGTQPILPRDKHQDQNDPLHQSSASLTQPNSNTQH